MEGGTRGGRAYFIAERSEDRERLAREEPGRPVFSFSEIEALHGAGPEEGEAVALVKAVFPEAEVLIREELEI